MTDNPLYSPEIEEAVIGDLLINPAAFNEIVLDTNDFYIKRHRWIFQAWQKLRENGIFPDIATVVGQLEDDGKLKEVGEAAGVSVFLNRTPNSINAADHVKKLKEFSNYRKVVSNSEKLLREIRNGRNSDEIHAIIDTITNASLGEETQNARYKIRDAAYALQHQQQPEFIVDRLIAPGSVSLLVGPEGVGKTNTVLSCGVCVALEKPWVGFVTKHRKVLVVDEESGDDRMALRFSAALLGELGDEKIKMEYVSLTRFNLRDPVDAVLLQDLIEETGAGLVIIDALVDIMPGGDENAVKDVHPVFMRLRKIAEETKAAIVIIHHTNKAGTYRGSTAMGGAVDLLIMAERKGGNSRIDFEIKKARDIEPFRFAAEMHFSDGQMWLTESEPRDSIKRLGKSQAYVIRHLIENGPSLISEITDHADTCTDEAARRAVYNLANLKMVERIDEGGPGEKATYNLTDNGKKYAEREGITA